MRRALLGLVLAPLRVAAGEVTPPPATAGVLLIEVTGVPSPGTLNLEVYDAQRQERWGETPLRRERLAVEGAKAAEWRVDGLPPGEYAVRVFLDQNGNGTLDRSRSGLPSEPFGFSNDTRRRLGVPRLKGASFRFAAPEQRITIQLKGRKDAPPAQDGAAAAAPAPVKP